MVLELVGLVATAPLLATTGPLLATSTVQLQDTAQKQQNDGGPTGKSSGIPQDEKIKRCHLTARATARMSESRKHAVRNKIIVLQQSKLYLRDVDDVVSLMQAHPFTGYLFPYPEKDYDGLVSTINARKFLNWIYMDVNTYEMKYGVRQEADHHVAGPASMLRSANDEWRITLNGWEGFLAVEESPGTWAMYFDKDDDGLKAKVNGKRVTEIELLRHVIPEHELANT